MGEGKGLADWLFNEFVAWEQRQPGRRSNYSSFARWLSENKYGIEISQPNISNWINGRYAPSGKYIWALADRLGNEIFQFYPEQEQPDLLLTFVINRWDSLPEDVQREIHETIERYTTDKGANDEAHKPEDNNKGDLSLFSN